jgi:sugar/nucleoside kinase (ribokinase family)
MAAWARRVAALRRRGITSSWDFGWNDVLARDPGLPVLIDALDVVFVNASEAALYAGEHRLEDALPFWRARRPIVVIKRGAKGCLAFGTRGALAVPARQVKVVDTTGAGDAFNGGFLAAWLRGAPLRRCLELGNRMGAASTRKVGGIESLPRGRREGARRRGRGAEAPRRGR